MKSLIQYSFSDASPFRKLCGHYFVDITYFKYSGALLIQSPLIRIIHLSGHMFGNQCLTYPEIQLSGQSVWDGGVQISEAQLYSFSHFS